MKILVLLNQILDPQGLTVNRRAGKVFVNKEVYVTDPASRRALETALRLKEAGGADVIAAAVGPARAADSLRDARARGADRGILISHLPLPPDEAVLTRLLAALYTQLGEIDLIFTGESALDTGFRVGPRLAEALHIAYLGRALACSVEKNVAHIVRRRSAHSAAALPGGNPASPVYNLYEADLPAVVAVTREGPALRYPHGGDVIALHRDPNAVETLTPADLGLSDSDLQPITAERGQSFPAEREFGKQMSVETLAQQLHNATARV